MSANILTDNLKGWIEERRLLCIDKQRLSDRIADLTTRIDNATKDELFVTTHAIERFEQRIMKIGRSKIRQLLSEASLLERYKKKGAGKYQLKSLTHCVCVVKDYAVVTVYNKEDPMENLEVARVWMHYCIDRAFVDTPTFYQFRKKFYK